ALGVSSAYLSALEHGNRGRPSRVFVQQISAYFNLAWDDVDELERLAELSHPRVIVNTAGLSPQATELANRLSEVIEDLDNATIERLLATLKDASRGAFAWSRGACFRPGEYWHLCHLPIYRAAETK